MKKTTVNFTNEIYYELQKESVKVKSSPANLSGLPALTDNFSLVVGL